MSDETCPNCGGRALKHRYDGKPGASQCCRDVIYLRAQCQRLRDLLLLAEDRGDATCCPWCDLDSTFGKPVKHKPDCPAFFATGVPR